MKSFRLMLMWALLVLVPAAAFAQDSALPDFSAVLPGTKARFWPVDPSKGYAVRELKPAIFLITDGRYQSLFATTDRGVVLFDAPPSLMRNIVQAVADVTKQPIVSLVYSHSHVDHIGGAGLILRHNPQLEIVAEEGVARFLREQNDPNRPAPTKVFKDRTTLSLGAGTAELKVGYWHSAAGDLFVYFPAQKILMAVDTLTAGQTVYMNYNLTQNMDAYMKVFDQILGYDFDILVTGHRSNPANREDVTVMKGFVTDVYDTVKRVNASDRKALIGRAVTKYGRDNGYPVARVVVESVVADCEKEINSRWLDKISNVDVFAASQCLSALNYFTFDVGPRQ